MKTLESGARIDIDAGASTCTVHAGRGSPGLSAASIIGPEGGERRVVVSEGSGPWTLPVEAGGDVRTVAVLYVADESELGRVEDRGPIEVEIGGDRFTLANRPDRHGALIVVEIYERGGRRVLRVRGDGHAFGVRAMAKKMDLPIEAFLGQSRAPRPDDRHGPRDRAPAGRPPIGVSSATTLRSSTSCRCARDGATACRCSAPSPG